MNEQFLDRVEGLAIRAVLGLLLLLVIFQYVLSVPACARNLILLEKFEGTDYVWME